MTRSVVEGTEDIVKGTPMMRALVIDEPGGPETLKLESVPRPEPAEGEIRVSMRAACVNPVDVSTRSGLYHGRWFNGAPRVGLGWDVAGVVSALGSGVTGFSLGDRVLGMNDRFTAPTRCQAEEVVLPASAVGHVPDALDLVTASTIPMNASTAAAALDAAGLTAGQSLLVTGAAAAVGGFAVSLAARQGVVVTGLAAVTDADLVRGFGAAHTVARGADYAQLGPFDAVVDTAMVGQPAIAAVRDKGRFIAVSPPRAPQSERGIEVTTIFSKPDGALVQQFAELAVQGEIFPRVAGTVRLSNAAEAYERVEHPTTRARWVLVP